MNDKHIIEMLESGSLQTLNADELNKVQVHTKNCDACRHAYDAARLAELVIKERVNTTFEPAPFFQTRVMAAIRESREKENVPVLLRLWKSAGGLVSSMAVTTAALAAFSFFIPATTPTNNAETVTLNAYSAERVLLGQNPSDEQMTYEQVLSTIYADDDEDQQP